ncbi:hypothetical protein DFP72DRAFT_932893 [Ephemerocybe angulata]|uniref:Uncharacterized protein n=1 Tax=Ephemerocybe angulata TaxID=980116 RepID=A0A8H6LVD2_9AGAR|nr:hypothetical protein DFP72DRAFT_932893 [Tulosesus angulatus]
MNDRETGSYFFLLRTILLDAKLKIDPPAVILTSQTPDASTLCLRVNVATLLQLLYDAMSRSGFSAQTPKSYEERSTQTPGAWKKGKKVVEEQRKRRCVPVAVQTEEEPREKAYRELQQMNRVLMRSLASLCTQYEQHKAGCASCPPLAHSDELNSAFNIPTRPRWDTPSSITPTSSNSSDTSPLFPKENPINSDRPHRRQALSIAIPKTQTRGSSNTTLISSESTRQIDSPPQPIRVEASAQTSPRATANAGVMTTPPESLPLEDVDFLDEREMMQVDAPDAPDAPGPNVQVDRGSIVPPQRSEAQPPPTSQLEPPAEMGPDQEAISTDESLWMTDAALNLYFDRFNDDLLECRACDAETIYTSFEINTPRRAIQDHFQAAHPDLTELMSYFTDELMVEVKEIFFG